jgi:GNAT superfamily N-acetyltransferase
MIEVRPVRTRSERKAFLTFPWKVYRDDPLWVPPLIAHRDEVSDPSRGPFFKHGRAEFFLARRDGKPAGTLCAAEDYNTTSALRGAQGEAFAGGECMLGFFDCVEDQAVASALFDAAGDWAHANRLTRLYGTYNLDPEDSRGLHIEGRDRPPAVLCGHAPPYYRDLFECNGFTKSGPDQLALAINTDVSTAPIQRLHRLAGQVRARKEFSVRGANMADWDDEITRIWDLNRRALATPDGAPFYPRQVMADLLAPFRDLVDPELILFAMRGDEPVGWLPGIRNFNEVLIHANGLRHFWNYLPLLWYGRRPARCLAIKSVVVPPEYWNSGAAVLLFDEIIHRANAKGYSWLDLSLTAEDNPQTITIAHRMGAQIYKRYRFYEKAL